MQYTVTIHQLTRNGAATQRAVVAGLHTTATSIVVPPGILQVGQTYAMQISASKTPNPDAPFRERFPSAQTTIVTSMFTPTLGSGGGTGMPMGPDAGTGGTVDAL